MPSDASMEYLVETFPKPPFLVCLFPLLWRKSPRKFIHGEDVTSYAGSRHTRISLLWCITDGLSPALGFSTVESRLVLPWHKRFFF